MGSSGHCLLRATRPGSIPPFAPTCCRGPSALGLGRFANSVRQTGLSLRPGTARLAPPATWGADGPRPPPPSPRAQQGVLLMWPLLGPSRVPVCPVWGRSGPHRCSPCPARGHDCVCRATCTAFAALRGLVLVPSWSRLGPDRGFIGPLVLSRSVCGAGRGSCWSLHGPGLVSCRSAWRDRGLVVVPTGSRAGLVVAAAPFPLVRAGAALQPLDGTAGVVCFWSLPGLVLVPVMSRHGPDKDSIGTR